VRLLASLDQLADDGDACRAQELAELGKIISVREGRDTERTLARALCRLRTVGGDRRRSRCAGTSAVSTSIHYLEV
jgi:hypothetical protein